MSTDISAPESILLQHNLPQADNAWEINSAPPHILPLSVQAPPSTNEQFCINLFRSSNNDSEFSEFRKVASTVFDQLQWDLYDVRRKHIQIIEESGISISGQQKDLLRAYYKGELALKELDPQWLNILQSKHPGEKAEISELLLRPTRKKACSTFIANINSPNNTWLIGPKTAEEVTQKVGDYDYRAIPRKYDPIPQIIIEHPAYRQILANVLHMVKQANPNATCLHITSWLMSCYSFSDLATTNSPEGIHQDGADYIVSAFVMERKNISGGISRVFHSDNLEQSIAEVVLDEGQGIFMSDAGSPLYHDLTHMHVANPEQNFGVRNILGFDIYLS